MIKGTVKDDSKLLGLSNWDSQAAIQQDKTAADDLVGGAVEFGFWTREVKMPIGQQRKNVK